MNLHCGAVFFAVFVVSFFLFFFKSGYYFTYDSSGDVGQAFNNGARAGAALFFPVFLDLTPLSIANPGLFSSSLFMIRFFLPRPDRSRAYSNYFG